MTNLDAPGDGISASVASSDRSGLIVGIGASAGGLGAYTAFLREVPPDSGLAFVLVQHLAPDHDSALAELLGRSTAMPVINAKNGTFVEANHVYVIPPNATLTIKDRTLSVSRPAPPRDRRRPIDTFFASLAEDQGENAVCIVLSGTGSDGSSGLKAVKEAGGYTFAQAVFDHTAMSGMPHSAVATGLVDEVMPVEAMAEKILSYDRHLAAMRSRKGPDGTRADMAEQIKVVESLLQRKTGHDFSGYKVSTVTRRIQRRMQVLQIVEMPEYISRLEKEPVQLDLLFNDMLIGVTRFFRDTEAFAALEKEAIPKLLENKGAEDQVRIWVCGCATGEEVYSIALLVAEAVERSAIKPQVQIFGTDIDEAAIAMARSGRYRKTAGISAERLARWFTEDGEDHCIIKELRNMCVFSLHSVIKDAPFSRLDLVSCRNLLIYLNPELQDRALRTFHYALRPNGILFLGPSEGMTRFTKFFTILDKKHRIFERRNGERPEQALFFAPPGQNIQRQVVSNVPPQNVDDRIDKMVRRALEKHSPAYVIVNEHEEIIRFSGGEAGGYIEMPSGAASLNLFGLLKKPLRPVVRDAMRAASIGGEQVVREGTALNIDGKICNVSVIVAQIAASKLGPKLHVIAFTNTGKAGASAIELAPLDSKHAPIEALEYELRTTKVQLQSTIGELEAANEDLRSATEEYQSVNEELQSSNEELETSKEEMQSINEELQTVNAEMSSKNSMLTQVNSDLKNLLDSTEIATIFLDSELLIKNFTPGMTDIFHLRDTDRGRPLTEIVSQVRYDDLKKDVGSVLRNLGVVDKELQLVDRGMTFIMRIRPYRTVDNVIDGVVITFMDISGRKKAENYQSLLMGELDHRVKNILSIVSSVITQTLKRSASPADFSKAVEGRIAAIARAHSLLTHSGGKDEALLGDLLAAELAPFDHSENKPVLTGPTVVLTPKAGLAIGMVIHELASNAVKFGALSMSKGRLAVEWNVAADALDQTLGIVWTELEGPAVKPPSRSGFGTILIERSLAQDFDGSVRREFLPQGLKCTINIPLTIEVGHLRSVER